MGIKYSSKQYELLVVQSLCTTNTKILGALASRVDKTYFVHPSASEAYQYIGEYISSNGKAPSLKILLADPDLSEETRKDLAESEELDEPIRSIEEADDIVKILHKYKQRRSIKGIRKLLEEELEGDQLDAELILTKISEAVAGAQSTRIGEDCFTHYGRNSNSAELTKSVLYDDHSASIIPTGIKEFDEVAGGLARGSLVLMGAPSGCGKSLVAGAIGVNIAHAGYKVQLSPLEMSVQEMHNRILAKVTRYPLKKIRLQELATGEKADIEAKMAAWEAETLDKGGRLTIYKPKGDVTIQELLAASMAFKSDVKIIDYVSLLADTDGEDQWRKLSAIARYCKIHAEAEDCVVILLVQVNEDGKVKYSSGMSEHANNALLWFNKKDIKETGLMFVEQTKSRNNSPRPFRLRQVHEFMDIESVADEVEALGAIAAEQEMPSISVVKK